MADGVQGNDDDDIFGGPLPPEDRLWRHPSEIAWEQGQRSRAPWGTALVSAAGGAFAVGAVLLAIGGYRGGGGLATQWVSLVPVETAPHIIASEEWTDEVSRIARPATVTVQTTDGSATLAGAVAVRDDGFYLTSGRAVGDHETVTIVTDTGDAGRARIVGHDPHTDVSVLRSIGTTRPAGSLRPADITEGEAVAIVDPEGDTSEHTVMNGAAAATTVDGDWLVGMVALDGDLGDTLPGSPAVDDTGAVVGLTAAIAPGEPTVIVPIDVAVGVAADLITTGVADHPRLGVTALDNRPPDEAGLKGARVSEVELGGPAEAGGIREGDVVLEIDGVGVTSLAAMVAELRDHRPGDVIDVIVMRDSRRVGCVVELASSEDPDRLPSGR